MTGRLRGGSRSCGGGRGGSDGARSRGEKRTRKRAIAADAKPLTASTKNDGKSASGSGPGRLSLLKKPRLSTKKPVPIPAPPSPSPSAAEAPPKVLANVESLRDGVDAALSTSDIPSSELIIAICDALCSIPVKQLLKQLPRAPRLLLHALHAGAAASHSVAAALAAAFTRLALAKTDSDKDVQDEAQKRASEWAVNVLCKHADTYYMRTPACEALPLLQRDAVQRSLISISARKIASQLQKNVDVYTARAAMDAVIPILETEHAEKIVSAAVNVASQSAVRILKGDAPEEEEDIISENFADVLVARRDGNALFEKLPIHVQSTVLRMQPSAWKSELSRLCSILSTRIYLSYSSRCQSAVALGHAAAHDVLLHWQLLDECENVRAFESAPDKTHIARMQVLFAAERALGDDTEISAPLINRLPVAMRGVMAPVFALAPCVRHSKDSAAAAANALEILIDLQLPTPALCAVPYALSICAIAAGACKPDGSKVLRMVRKNVPGLQVFVNAGQIASGNADNEDFENIEEPAELLRAMEMCALEIKWACCNSLASVALNVLENCDTKDDTSQTDVENARKWWEELNV